MPRNKKEIIARLSAAEEALAKAVDHLKAACEITEPRNANDLNDVNLHRLIYAARSLAEYAGRECASIPYDCELHR